MTNEGKNTIIETPPGFVERVKIVFREYPAKFWVLIVAMFIDRLGGTLIFPFFALYITQKFDVGMTEAGVLLMIFSVAGMAGNFLGGAMTDRFGRKGMVLFGLVFSALSSVTMGLVNDLQVFYLLAVVVGFLSDIAGPAWQAMIADILPEEQRAEGFGIMRVVANLSWIVGPTIGGFMAARSYLMLFILDAITSLITAGIIFRLIPETMPERIKEKVAEPFFKTFTGYLEVLKDGLYIGFVFVSMLMAVVYLQMYSTLSVFLRDVHGVSEQGYGFVMSSSAITVIILQFWVTRKIKKYAPMLMMALGTAFYLVGFSMFGYVSVYPLFVLAVVIITGGEMIVMPVSQALAANFAPEDMRGRYLAIFSLGYFIPSTFGPLAAGLIMDNFNPNWVWYLSGMISAVAAAGFLGLHSLSRKRLAKIAPETVAAD